MKGIGSWFLAIVVGLTLVGCGNSTSAQSPAQGGTQKVQAVTTTSIVGDLVKNIGGDRVEVTSLMGPGVDPHLYKASASDIDALVRANIVFYNGLELEGRMTDVFVKLASEKPTLAVAEGISADQLREPPEFQGKYDPHIWFDVMLWKETIEPVVRGLSQVDPAGAEIYARNGEAYAAELETLHAEVKALMESIPPEARVLVTAHDAFGYFGRQYNVEVYGLQGTSTAAEAGAADVQRLAELIVSRKIKAIFVETSVPESTINAVQAAVNSQDWDVAIGGKLFSDAMGSPGTPQGTYVGMVRHNAQTIAQALK